LRISNEKLDEMFLAVGVSRDNLHSCLRTMGTEYLFNQQMKDMWKPEFPSINYCYTVCEYVYWYVCGATTEWDIRTTDIPSTPGIKHWFLRRQDGMIIDLTADQFDNYAEMNYNDSRRSGFIQSGCIGPSKRARILATMMGHDEDSWKRPVSTLFFL
jgi:hypothetical protein